MAKWRASIAPLRAMSSTLNRQPIGGPLGRLNKPPAFMNEVGSRVVKSTFWRMLVLGFFSTLVCFLLWSYIEIFFET